MRRIQRGVADMEAKMRRVGMVLALVLAFQAASDTADAQVDAVLRDSGGWGQALEACVVAAGASRAALERCKGGLASDCVEGAGGDTTVGMARCYDGEARAWTAQLDAALERARADDARATLLARSQEAWVVWRQAECRYQAAYYEGGSLARVLAASCFADLTADRAIALIYAERTEDE
jgi:uncharacterized protein YecT (DUF1311 family)